MITVTMYRKIFITTVYLLLVIIAFISSFITKINTPFNEKDSGFYAEEYRCSFPVAVVGDLQRTSIWESIIGRESNDVERKEIIESIKEQKPGSVILLGDMVFQGDNIEHWKYFDNLMNPLNDEHIPLFPVLGNHEYWGKNRIALQYLAERFPVLKNHHWYVELCDSIALIFLDSNNLEYDEEQWIEQTKWFKNKLRKYDNVSSVKGIIVLTHHPPYTNCFITGNEMQIKTGFASAFENSKKTLAFISAHAHTYERFVEKGKTFIVSGGGGGPRIMSKRISDRYHDYYNGPFPRPFNYLLIDKGKDGLLFTVRGVKKGEIRFFTMDKFEIPYIK